MTFKFKRLEIEDVILIEPQVFTDERGFFMESYKKSDFESVGINADFIQDNHSKSSRGVLRGLHYQLSPKAQGKLVRVIQGEIFDVAVDIRAGSKTFGKWVGEKLSAENNKMLYMPEGFAHGFLTLSETAEILYKATNEYDPALDRGILWNDPDININWAIDFEPVLSTKDKNQPRLKELI